MALTYAVRADVVDLRADRPRSTDVFLVDTNVYPTLAGSRLVFW